MDQRFQQLTQWTEQQLGACDLQPLAGDASFRRYFRVRTINDSFVLMDAPPTHESSDIFVALSGEFAALDINVPRVLAQNLELGFLLLSDLGDDLFLELLNKDSADHLYHDAFKVLLKLQSYPAGQLPKFDREFMLQELQRLQDWYLPYLVQAPVSASQQVVLENTYDFLITEILKQPLLTIHRDYHSRNLLRCAGNTVGVIDFQDAMLGPITYDLGSLLRDCYITWPAERVRSWALQYRQLALAAGILPACSERQFLRWFDFTSLQRHLKVLGIFARLHLRDGKSLYLQDIPRALEYVNQVCAQHPELQAFNNLWSRWHA